MTVFCELARTGEEMVVTYFEVLSSNSPRRYENKNKIGQSLWAVSQPRNYLDTSQMQARIFTLLVNLLGCTCVHQLYQYGSQESRWGGKCFGMVKMYMVWILWNDMQLLLIKMKVTYYNIRIFMEMEIKFLICIQYWHQPKCTCVLKCTNLVYMCVFVGAIIVPITYHC
jgi:hypothetical protein